MLATCSRQVPEVATVLGNEVKLSAMVSQALSSLSRGRDPGRSAAEKC